MKKIIFIRHARAEDPASEISDFERSLTIKGKLVSKQMAKRFKERESNPGLIISSPAFRALETAIIFAGEFSIKPDNIILDFNLYHKADIKYLLGLLEKMSEDTDTLTFFGHNPAFTEMPDRLCADGCEFLTKTSVVGISFPVKTWKEVRPDKGKQEYFLKPEK